ncbi:hypothetical protein [Saccharothrix syringae]|uniref:Uncharacterized protein n=1 Tax=Saccharothrix syringae TaxID=103733 RepID=A0A5Q0H2X6_SACSY|nr:hypothetical protein [Saccharothrix syringae]QFZ20551.1 hypothetical protein EKG83_26880 [Saccharothrix syringae]
MSAWIVSSSHIDVLVHALAQYGVVPSDLGAVGFRELGQRLWHENHKSVNHRYREDTSTPRYELRTTEATLDPIVVLKAVTCFNYQSCEHPGWPDSEAHDLMHTLRTAILERHPDLGERVAGPDGETDRYTTLPTYDRAPWGIESLDQAISVSS